MRTRLLAALIVFGLTAPLAAQTTIAGEKGPNVSPPSTTKNLPVMPAIACSSAQTLTAGRVVFPCVDVNGSYWFTPRNSDGTAATLAVDVTEDAPSVDAVTGPLGMEVRRDAAVSSASTDGDYATKNQDGNGLSWTRFLDPCSGVQKTTTPISITTDTVIISAVSAKRNYICALVVVASAAEIVAVTEGTGSVCGTSEAALVGSTTDANGLSFAANGGLGMGGANATIIAGKTTNVDTCLNVSGANRVSGWVTWVQAP